MTTTEQTYVRDSRTEPGYGAEGNRLAAGALLRCWIRERGVHRPVAADGVESADVGAGASSLRLKITQMNGQTVPADLDELVELIAAAGAAEDRP